MELELILTGIADLLAAALRGFIAGMSHVVGDAYNGALVRMAPVLLLPFAATRALTWRTPPMILIGLSIFGMELYLTYNRLTVFLQKPLTVADLIGHLSLVVIGIVLICLRPPRRVPRRKDHD